MFDLVLRVIIIGTFAFIAIGGVWIIVQTVRRLLDFRKTPQGKERHSAGGLGDIDASADFDAAESSGGDSGFSSE